MGFKCKTYECSNLFVSLLTCGESVQGHKTSRWRAQCYGIQNVLMASVIDIADIASRLKQAANPAVTARQIQTWKYNTPLPLIPCSPLVKMFGHSWETGVSLCQDSSFKPGMVFVVKNGLEIGWICIWRNQNERGDGSGFTPLSWSQAAGPYRHLGVTWRVLSASGLSAGFED